MSKYTTEVRFICETYAGYNESQDYPIDTIIAKSREKVFNFDFPIFDENYRAILETKILKHYYTREICAETVGLWKHWLNTRMNEIMPYYNQLYKSELIEFNPLYDADYTTKRDDTGTAHSTGNAKGVHEINNDDTDWRLFSDTPQGALTNVENQTYLTDATKNTHKGKENGNNRTDTTNDIKTTDDYLEHVTGKRGYDSFSKRLLEYRETFLNIDMMIIEELSDLFFNIW